MIMLFVEPHSGPQPVIQVITDARRQVDLNVYYLSSRPILSALQRAARRGVQVRVILDEKPYGMRPAQVRKEAENLQRIGARFHWAPARFEQSGGHWAFDHAKYVCNGHECEIGTANYDWSAFHRNREYLYVTRNPRVVTAARAVFAADWAGQRAPAWAHEALVLSPGSQADLVALLSRPGPVEVDSEEMGDDRAILAALAAKGSSARVILPSSISRQDRRNVSWLVEHGVQVRLLPKRPVYVHAKMILAGGEAFIGSENFSEASLNENREMGVVLTGPRDLAALSQSFEEDWSRARPFSDSTREAGGYRSESWWHHWSYRR